MTLNPPPDNWSGEFVRQAWGPLIRPRLLEMICQCRRRCDGLTAALLEMTVMLADAGHGAPQTRRDDQDEGSSDGVQAS